MTRTPTAGPWPATSITPSDENFFTTAAFVLPASIDLPHSPAQIWEAITDERLGARMGIVARASWIAHLNVLRDRQRAAFDAFPPEERDVLVRGIRRITDLIERAAPYPLTPALEPVGKAVPG